MAVLGRDWVIADFVTDIAELVIPALDMVEVIESLPSDINTITDLYKFLKSASGLIYDGMQVKGNAQAAANTLVNNFKKQAFFYRVYHLHPGQFTGLFPDVSLSLRNCRFGRREDNIHACDERRWVAGGVVGYR